MNSPPGPKAAEPHDASIARADERLTHAHEEIVRADEQLARLSEQVARMERDAARAPSAGPGPQSPPARRPLGVLVGLPLAACIVVTALALHSSYGGGAKPVVAPAPPQLVSTPSLPPENPPPAAEPAPPAVEVAAAEAAPAQATPVAQTTPQATPVAQSAPQDTTPTVTVPTAAAAPPDHTQLLQTMARDLANLERSIEQLKATQQQMASDNSKEISELKASQEEIKRVLAKVSEQNLSRASPPPAPPAPAVRKPERTVQSPRPRARPRIRRDWYYDDDW